MRVRVTVMTVQRAASPCYSPTVVPFITCVDYDCVVVRIYPLQECRAVTVVCTFANYSLQVLIFIEDNSSVTHSLIVVFVNCSIDPKSF